MGIVSVLYGLLLHEAPKRPTILNSEPDKPQKAIPSPTLKVAVAVMQMLNATAEMDLKLVQVLFINYFWATTNQILDSKT